MPKTLRKPATSQLNSVSVYGRFQAFLTDGITARVFMVIKRIFEMIGCFANIQIPVASKAKIKVTVSDLVISLSPILRPKTNSTKHSEAVTKVNQAPIPA